MFIALSGLGLTGCSPPSGGPGDTGRDSALPPHGNCSDIAAGSKRRVFITRQVFRGDLINGGGLAGGDDACNDAARAAGLSPTFKAWLSTSTVNAIDRMADVGPWCDLSDMLIFWNRSRLMTDPQLGLWLDEKGQYLDNGLVWTGTRGGGLYEPLFKACKDWTSASMTETASSGFVGRTDEQRWTESASAPCNLQIHLMCFEQ